MKTELPTQHELHAAIMPDHDDNRSHKHPSTPGGDDDHRHEQDYEKDRKRVFDTPKERNHGKGKGNKHTP